MASERFPKRKYLRQLRDMQDDLSAWALSYYSASSTTTAEWLQGRFMDRAALLEEVARQVRNTYDLLEELPRLR